MALFSRAPIAYAFGKANTSDQKLITKLKRYLKKGDLLLIDGGFYAFRFFKAIVEKCPFVIPMDRSGRPRVIQTISPGDYLCEIRDSKTKETMKVRILYAYRKGFRRRRIVTSLLDPIKYPPQDIANLYHMRWTIETYYNDFKNTMQGNKWHCQTPHTFELILKMVLTCLMRLAMNTAAKSKGLLPGSLSFARALTETRIFLRKITSQIIVIDWRGAYANYVKECSLYLIKIKPGRSFPRDKQAYRKKSRGFDRGKVGRPQKNFQKPFDPEPEVTTNWKKESYLLS